MTVPPRIIASMGTLVVAGCMCVVTVASAAEGQSVATVVGRSITLEQITPSEAESQKQILSAAEYESWLLRDRTRLLLMVVVGEVLRDYARREKLTPSDDELATLFDGIVKEHVTGKELTAQARERLTMQRFWAEVSAREWRTAKSLYEKYGGRVAVSAFGGWVSFEGRNSVLKEYADRGDLKFHQADLERVFWEMLRNERMVGDVFLRPEHVADHFTRPPWEHFQRVLAEEATKPPAARNGNGKRPAPHVGNGVVLRGRR
jgi:hypothetical protein